MTAGQRFLTTLREQDFDAMRSLFADDVWLRAMLVREIVERHDADAVVALFRGWYEQADDVAVVDAQHHTMEGREFVRYRLRLRPPWAPDRWHVVEQAGFLTEVDGRVRRLDLTCTGFYMKEPVGDVVTSDAPTSYVAATT
jgi:hypothetical protein